jgi:WD40 repeat protein
VSHLAEHRRAVNRLALTGNGQLLLSASDDETVKVFILLTIIVGALKSQTYE